MGVFRAGVLLVCSALCFLIRPLALGQAPSSTESPSAAMDRADKLIKQGKTEEAVAVLDPLAQKKPSLPGVETLLGRAYFTSKTYQQAIHHLQLAIEQAPEDWESIQLLALSYYALGRCQETVPLLEKVSPHLPQGQADAPYILGVCYARAGQSENARRAFAQMFGVAPDPPRTLPTQEQQVAAAVNAQVGNGKKDQANNVGHASESRTSPARASQTSVWSLRAFLFSVLLSFKSIAVVSWPCACANAAARVRAASSVR